MPVPVFQPGYVLAASDVNAWMVPLTAYKLSATARTSSTAQVADPDLELGFAQGGIWVIEAVIRFSGPAGNNLSWGWQTSAPGIAGNVAGLVNNSSGNLELSYRPWTYAAWLAQTTGIANEFTIRFNGMVSVGGTGSLAFAWGQGASSATATTVDVGSYLMAWRAN